MRWTELALISRIFAIMAEVQCVASTGGAVWVSVTTRSVMFEPNRRMREGRVISRRRPSYPSCISYLRELNCSVRQFDVGTAISGLSSRSLASPTESSPTESLNEIERFPLIDDRQFKFAIVRV